MQEAGSSSQATCLVEAVTPAADSVRGRVASVRVSRRSQATLPLSLPLVCLQQQQARLLLAIVSCSLSLEYPCPVSAVSRGLQIKVRPQAAAGLPCPILTPCVGRRAAGVGPSCPPLPLPGSTVRPSVQVSVPSSFPVDLSDLSSHLLLSSIGQDSRHTRRTARDSECDRSRSSKRAPASLCSPRTLVYSRSSSTRERQEQQDSRLSLRKIHPCIRRLSPLASQVCASAAAAASVSARACTLFTSTLATTSTSVSLLHVCAHLTLPLAPLYSSAVEGLQRRRNRLPFSLASSRAFSASPSSRSRSCSFPLAS